MKNIHILPTDKPSRLAYDFNKLILNSKLLSPTLYKNQNIYITNSEKPKAGEWFYVKTPNIYGGNIVAKCLGFGKYSWSENILTDTTDEKGYHPSHCVKIILTDNKDLIKDGVQAIDDEFLEWFVKNPSCEWVEIQCRYNFYAGQDLIHYTIIIPTDKPDRLAIPLDCTHDIVTKYGVAECQNCGLEESKISKQLTDLEIAIKLEEIEREEPKQTDENGKPITYWGGLEKPKQETLEEAAERMYPINSTGGVMEMLNKHQLNNSYKQEGFIAGAKSDAAKDYWFEKFQQEQDNTKFSDEDMVEFSKWRVIYEENNPNNVKHSKKLLQIWFEQDKKKQNNEQ